MNVSVTQHPLVKHHMFSNDEKWKNNLLQGEVNEEETHMQTDCPTGDEGDKQMKENKEGVVE